MIRKIDIPPDFKICGSMQEHYLEKRVVSTESKNITTC